MPAIAPSLNASAALAMLQRARELVAQGWAQEALARTASGRIVSPTAPSARRFCLVGALVRAEFELYGEEWEDVELNVVYEGSPAFVTALTLLASAATLTIVHPREFSDDWRRKSWAAAALQAPSRGLVDIANDIGPQRKREVLATYDLAIALAQALAPLVDTGGGSE